MVLKDFRSFLNCKRHEQKLLISSKNQSFGQEGGEKHEFINQR